MMYNLSDVETMEKRFRANFINSLGGFKSCVLIGSKSLVGNENLAIFSSLFHLGANPALCGIIIRPSQEKENTLGNMVRTKSFTINHILPSFYEKGHQSSAKYMEGESEFEKVKLTPEYHEEITAPFVKESIIKFGCELQQKIDIEINGTYLMIGKITKIIVPDYLIAEDGYIDLERAETITCSGLDSYHQTTRLARLKYAKPENN